MPADSSRLLVLGAGRHQVPLITRAEERGIRVVAVSYLPDDPGKALATWPADASAIDTAAVVGLAATHDVDGIVTTGTDMAVVTMADAAAALGLPCYLSPQSARLATDKILMTAALETAGGNRPRNVEVGAADDPSQVAAGLRFPLVVKPCDSQGQRGITRVDEPEGLADSVAAAIEESRTSRAIVEEFVTGPEITASAWVSNGDPHVLMATDRVTYNPPPSIGIAIRHVSPSRHAAGRLAEVTEQVNAVARAYQMSEGPLYVQMLAAADRMVLVEAGARIGGGHEADLIPAACGVDVIDRMIDLALTGSAEPVTHHCDEDSPGAPALVEFLLARPGEVAAANGFPTGDPGEVAGGFYVGPGHIQGPTINSLDRVGWFLAAGPDSGTVLAAAARIHGRLTLAHAGGTNLLFLAESDLVLG